MGKVLILGGTTEANRFAALAAEKSVPAIYSYAGRVNTPKEQPLPTRVGGFGGVNGLTEFIKREGICTLIDATHPFASQMSKNAIEASELSGIPLLAIERPAWQETPDDQWIHVKDMKSAATALEGPDKKIFLAIGRQQIDLFSSQLQHHYLLRFVDQPEQEIPFPSYDLVVDRGPFDLQTDLDLLKRFKINVIVSKNAGGTGAFTKIQAARDLGLSVIMIDRPALSGRNVVADERAALNWLHSTCPLLFSRNLGV